MCVSYKFVHSQMSRLLESSTPLATFKGHNYVTCCVNADKYILVQHGWYGEDSGIELHSKENSEAQK